MGRTRQARSLQSLAWAHPAENREPGVGVPAYGGGGPQSCWRQLHVQGGYLIHMPYNPAKDSPIIEFYPVTAGDDHKERAVQEV